MNIAYFPGCSLHGMAAEYDLSTRLVCKHLGLNLQEITDWNCCGATAAHSMDHLLSVSLGARNLNIVKQMNLDLITAPCAGCFNRLKTASYELRQNSYIVHEVEKIIGAPAPVEPQVNSLLQLFIEHKGLAEITKQVVKPLTGLKAAAYYGCLLTRPSKIVQYDASEQPMTLDLLLESLGAESVKWAHKAECCGGGYSACETSIVIDLGGQILESAYQAGAEVIVVACPMCQSNLDSRQKAIESDRGHRYNLPVIYFTQLMGLALGYSPKQVGLQKLLTSPFPILRSKGLI